MLSSTRTFRPAVPSIRALLEIAVVRADPPPAARHGCTSAVTRSGPVSRLRWSAIWLVVAVLAAAALVRPVRAQDADTVTLNFVNADIDAVVQGRRRDHRPQLRRSIRRSRARSTSCRHARCRKSLVYPTLLSALRMQGFTAVESDGVVKIVPEADAKLQGGAGGERRRGRAAATAW